MRSTGSPTTFVAVAPPDVPGTASSSHTATATDTVHGGAETGGWLWMALAFVATGVSQLGSQLVAGRLLGPAAYGQVATLINLMSFVGVPLVAVQLTVTGLVARGGSVRATLRRYVAVGVLAGMAAAATAPWWTAGLAVTSAAAARVAAGFLPATFLVAVARGNAVGQGRSRRLAAAMTVGAVVRLVVSAAGAAWFGTVGAVAGAVVAELAIGVALVLSVRPTGTPQGLIVGREAVGATYTQVAMWIVINVDLLWARRLLGADDAGRYLLVGGVAVGLVSFGQANLWHQAAASVDPTAAAAIVRRSAAIVAAASIIGLPVAAVTLPLLVGREFSGLAPLLAMAGLWAVGASVMQTGTATQLIAGRRGLHRVVPVAVAAVAGPPLWVMVLGPRPIALSVAAVVNTLVGATVVMWSRASNGEVAS